MGAAGTGRWLRKAPSSQSSIAVSLWQKDHWMVLTERKQMHHASLSDNQAMDLNIQKK